MPRSFFFRIFPVPDYLARPAAGLDISDRSIKFAVLSPRGRELRLKTFGEKGVPFGLIEAGQIKNPLELTSILKELAQQWGLRYVIASLPEEPAYVVRLKLPSVRASELRSAIELQLEDYVPLKAAESVFDYEILKMPPNTKSDFELSVLVIAKNLTEAYLEVLQAAGLQPLAFEAEAQAIARTVVPRAEKASVLIIDIGKTRTSFFVAKGNVLLSTSTVSTFGGDNLTQTVAKALECSANVAEAMKIERGLLRSKKDNQLIFALLPPVSVLKDEILKRYNYWNTNEAHGENEQISRLILSGGQSALPGLVEYLSTYIDVPIELANVWINLMDIKRNVPPITFNNSQKYATALGLALRNSMKE